MKRCLFGLIVLLPLLLAACSGKTALHFVNKTECGTATIELQNKNTGHLQEHTVGEGQELEIEVTPGIPYHYTVTYAGPDESQNLRCDDKEVETLLTKGQTITVNLESVRDPSLPTATATTAPTTTPEN